MLTQDRYKTYGMTTVFKDYAQWGVSFVPFRDFFQSPNFFKDVSIHVSFSCQVWDVVILVLIILMTSLIWLTLANDQLRNHFKICSKYFDILFYLLVIFLLRFSKMTTTFLNFQDFQDFHKYCFFFLVIEDFNIFTNAVSYLFFMY